MAGSLHEFVAEDAWLAAIFVTIGLGVVASAANLEAVSEAVFTLGFVVVMPALLFWGEEVADLLVGEPPERDRAADAGSDADAAADADAVAKPGEARPDPIEELKRRYASGEVDELEFERRVERILALDGVDADDADVDALLGEARETPAGSGADPELGTDADPTASADLERER